MARNKILKNKINPVIDSGESKINSPVGSEHVRFSDGTKSYQHRRINEVSFWGQKLQSSVDSEDEGGENFEMAKREAEKEEK